MKNIIFSPLLVSIFLFGCLVFVPACKKNKSEFSGTIPVNFEYNYPIISPVITFVDSPLVFDTYEFPTNTDEVLKESNSSGDLLQEAKLVYLTMRLTHPDTANFDFIKNISLYLFDDELGETKGAYKEVPEKGLRFIEFDLTGEDIHLYLKKEKVQFRIKGELRKPMESSVVILVQSRFSGKAGVL
jgi:hypothetical protein